jgi:hypothetical protein
VTGKPAVLGRGSASWRYHVLADRSTFLGKPQTYWERRRPAGVFWSVGRRDASDPSKGAVPQSRAHRSALRGDRVGKRNSQRFDLVPRMTEPGSPPTSSETVFYQREDGRSFEICDPTRERTMKSGI